MEALITTAIISAIALWLYFAEMIELEIRGDFLIATFNKGVVKLKVEEFVIVESHELTRLHEPYDQLSFHHKESRQVFSIRSDFWVPYRSFKNYLIENRFFVEEKRG